MSKEQDIIRELVRRYGNQSALWGCTLTVLDANEAVRLEKDLLAAIDRLERKAATAKAECDAWREWESAYISLSHTKQVELDKARDRVAAANKSLAAAHAATDEAWKEPENKEHQP